MAIMKKQMEVIIDFTCFNYFWVAIAKKVVWYLVVWDKYTYDK